MEKNKKEINIYTNEDDEITINIKKDKKKNSEEDRNINESKDGVQKNIILHD